MPVNTNLLVFLSIFITRVFSYDAKMRIFAYRKTFRNIMRRDHTEELKAFERLLDIIDDLREKCPWDSKQTFDSLRPLTIEETYELADAIMQKDYPNITKEMGDVLMHILFYARIGDEAGQFNFVDVCNKLCDKLIYRHPHIYGNVSAETPEDVERNWEALKTKEKGGNKRVLSGVPASLPSLIKAYRIQDKARNVGFDWEVREDVWKKVREEYEEVQSEIDSMDADKMTGEFGDLLFAIVNAARLYGVDPDNALERTNQKFIKRFNYIEDKTKEKGLELKDLDIDDMDELWDEAKSADC